MDNLYRTLREQFGISGSIIEQTVKRVVAQWKKAAKQNPTDPVSVMVEDER